MTRWNIDVETRSTVDLRKTSAKVYARHPDTDIVLVRYCWEETPSDVREWRCYRDPLPDDLRGVLTNKSVTLVAHNAGFEHAILTAPHLVGKYKIPKIQMDRWDDTAARAARMALPRSLDQAAKALKLPVTKDIEGSRVMMQLCKPRAYTDDGPTWWTPEEFPEKYDRLSDYCAIDVQVGTQLSETTRPLTPKEREIWLLTEEINETGLYVDWRFAEVAVKVANLYITKLDLEMKLLTGGEVEGSRKVTQLKNWLAAQGFKVLDALDDDKIILDKGAIASLLARDDLPSDVRRTLEIRRAAAKSSVAKYEAILNRVDKENSRVRDTLVYHGASTGRWAGAGIQPQNFPRRTVTDWENTAADVRDLSEGSLTFEEFEETHGEVMDVLSRMLRGTITAPDGASLIFPDFAAIEARGVAWLSGCTSLTGLFASGGKVYEEFAAKIYHKKVADIGKDSTERFLAKTAILGAGYGMGWKKFILTCAAQGKEVSDADAMGVIEAYRGEYSEIPALWKGLENAAMSAVRHRGREFSYQGNPDMPETRVSYLVRDGFLLCKKPSGGLLFYAEPRLIMVSTPFGEREAIEYSTVNSLTKQWTRETTWGGRLTENVVQAICRDLIAEAMLRLRAKGYKIVGTVHDEVIVETPEDVSVTAAKSDILKTMCQVPEWGKGFPISAEAGSGSRYGK